MLRARIRQLLFAVTLVLAAPFALAACGHSSRNPIQVKTSSAEVASSVARYKTYAHEASPSTAPAGHTTESRSPLLIAKTRARVDAELQRKGYVLAQSAAGADMIVRINSGVKQVVDQPTGKLAAEGAPSEIDTVSTLAIEIRERATGQPLFVASAQKEIHSQIDDRDVAAAVAEIVEPIPPATR